MNSSVTVAALGDWDRAGNDAPLAKLTTGQVSALNELEAYMEGKRTIKEVSTFQTCYITN